MYIQTFIDKDAQIIKDSYVNMGLNPQINLFFGGTYLEPEYSRYLFHFDVERLKELYSKCYLQDLSNVQHILKFKLTGYFGSSQVDCANTNYQIYLFKLNQHWEEGCGNTECVDPCGDVISLNICNDNVVGPVNWYEAESNQLWDIEGVYNSYSAETEYLQCISVNCSDEYISFDVTNIVNDLITGDTTNYGYGIAFDSSYELYPPFKARQGLSFFSKDTGTYFKPFVATFIEKPIIDTRESFYCEETNTLCFYAQKRDGSVIQFDENPIVNVYDSNEELFNTYTATCLSYGIYGVDINLTDCQEYCGIWTDVWTNLKVNGVEKSDVTLEFDVKNDDSLGYKFKPKKYAFTVNGIKRNEHILAQGIRKIYVYARENYTYKNVGLDNLFYRLYVKQGTTKVLVSDWLQANKGICENWFYLDCESLLAQTYYLDIKHESGGSEFVYSEEIKFTIVNSL